MTYMGIIGAGHVGCALAFDCASRGHEVILRGLPGHPGNIPKIIENDNYLQCTGVLSGRVPVRVCRDLSDATSLPEAVIFVAVPSQGHDVVLNELARHDLKNTIAIFITGNAVAVKAYRLLNAKMILDTTTSPYSSRVTAEGGVSVRGVKKRLQIGSVPAITSEYQRGQIANLFCMPLEWSTSLLEIFFSSLNGVVHVPTALLNLGWIETTNGDFYFYRQGMSSGVCRIIEAADKERLAVGAAYHCRISSALDTFNTNYGMQEKTLREFANNTAAHNKTKGAQKRFLSQDVPYWLVLCSDLGARAGVPTPFIDFLILLTSTFSGADYRKTGRSLNSLGLGGLSTDEILDAFNGSETTNDEGMEWLPMPLTSQLVAV